jgi:hypothetical protein
LTFYRIALPFLFYYIMLNVFYEVAAFAPTVFERTIMMLIRSSYGKSRQSCAAKVAVYLP